MVDLKELQKIVYQNKVDHNFNVTDIPFEFCLLMTEVAEAFRSRETSEYGEELADIAIYLLGLAEIGGVDLEKEIVRKIEKNRRSLLFFLRQTDADVNTSQSCGRKVLGSLSLQSLPTRNLCPIQRSVSAGSVMLRMSCTLCASGNGRIIL